MVALQNRKLRRRPHLLLPPRQQSILPPNLPQNTVQKSRNQKTTQARILRRRPTRTQIPQQMIEQRCSGWPPSARQRLLHGVRRHVKMPWQLEVRTTFAAPFVAFWDMSTLGKPNFWTKCAPIRWSKYRADVFWPSDPANERAGGRSWRHHTTNRCNLLSHGGY